MAASTTLRIVDPQPEPNMLGPAHFDLSEGPQITVEGGVAKIEHGDGSATFDFDGAPASTSDNDKHYDNLADKIASDELASIANELLTGIDADLQSRKEWVDTRAAGIKLLGLKLEEPRGDLGASSAPLEGMSTFRHPVLLEAVIRFQATARGELLPASGPVKVRNDLPSRPDAPQPPQGMSNPMQPNPMMGDNGGPPLEPEGQAMDDLGSALEKDMNHYLTVTATEYVPDTDRMLFYIGFGGDGFKKVYNCPLRRRPVSESVDADDLIISNAATDIRNCGRVTHRIKMRPSVLRRMQIAGSYRDISVGTPNPMAEIDQVQQAKAEVGGYKPRPLNPKDAEYEVYECYCELDLPDFAPSQFKDKGLPLPYVVTIEKQSRQVLSVTRNWDPDDEECMAEQVFVQFPFIRGLGFYGLGLIHILGNITMALTAIIRIMIDNGMFANFPGFLFAKGAGRQNTNQIRIPPGGGFPVDVPPGMKIQDAFMPAPYKETGAAFTNLATHLEELAQRLGQTADLNIGEGKQDVPVGTTMALIEQATKIMDSVHKRLHAAQAEEFGLLKNCFKKDPEAFWRHNKKPARQWAEQEFLQALDQRELVPVADPNNPTSLHRIAKAVIIDTLVQKYPLDMDRRAALKRIMSISDIDANGLMNQQPASPPPDPRMAAISAKAQAEQMSNQIEQVKLLLQKQQQEAKFADQAQERQFKMQMQQAELHLEQLRVQAEMVIHAHDITRANQEANANIAGKQAQTVHDIAKDHAQHQAEIAQDTQRFQHEMATTQARNAQQMAADRERHSQQMEMNRETHQAKLEQSKDLAAAQAKAAANKPKPQGGK